jgi:2'-5' RNA ligase
MPDSVSIWLIPPSSDHAFNKSLQELISVTLPRDFPHAPKNEFIPHVTVVSDFNLEKSPQEWLDSLSFPDFKKEKNEVVIELEQLEAGETFFKKVTLRAKKDANLLKLAANVREQAKSVSLTDAQSWAEKEYMPHLSLFYGDISIKDVKNKIPMIETQMGFELGSLFDCCGGTFAMGAKLVVVDTSDTKDLSAWKVLAERHCPWVIWTMARGLL